MLSGSYPWVKRFVSNSSWQTFRRHFMSLLFVMALMCLDASADLIVRQAAGSIQTEGFRQSAATEKPVSILGFRPEQKPIIQAVFASMKLVAGEFKVSGVIRSSCEAESVILTFERDASAFYGGQLRTSQTERWLDDLGVTNRSFLLVHDAFRAGDPQAFDGSNYALIKLVYRQCLTVQTQQLLFCDFTTGEIMTSPVTPVFSRPNPIDPVTQGSVARVLLAGGLLFGLLCYRKQPLQSLKSDPTLVANLHWPELLAIGEVVDTTSVTPLPTVPSCIYNRMLRALTQDPGYEQNPNIATIPLFWRCFQGLDEVLSLAPNPWSGRQRLASTTHIHTSPALS